MKGEASQNTVSTTEPALEIKATRKSEAEVLAVARHQKINMVWEYTQAFIANTVIVTVLGTCCFIAVTTKDEGKRTASLLFMTGLANLVAGFYFGRTNHSRPTGEDER